MKKPWRLLLYILGGIAGIWLTAKFLLPIGLPFLLGLLLAKIAKKPVAWLEERSKFPRWLCSFVVVSLISAALAGTFWLLGKLLFSELEQLAIRLPQILPDLSLALSQLHDRLLGLADRLPGTVSTIARSWLDRLFEGSSVVVDTASGWLISLVGDLISWVPELFLFLLTMFLSAYLFSSQWQELENAAKKVIPGNWLERFRMIKQRLKNALGGYVKAQAYLAGITFALLLIGLFFLGRNRVFLTALLIALLDALPIFGAGVVLIPWAVFAFLQGQTGLAAGLLVLYALCALIRSFLEPKFLGKQMGLHPLLTLLSLYAGFRLFGILGMILVPVGVILVKQLYDLWK